LESIRERRAEIVDVLMWEIAKTASDAAKEFDRTVEFAQQVIAAIRAGEYVSDAGSAQEFADVGGVRATVRRGPVGVALFLAPYNYPLNELYAMCVPALLMGNCVVLKLPAIGALAHILTVDALLKHFPKGVINFVTGSGRATLPGIMGTGKVDALGFIGGSNGADALVKAHPHPHRLKVFSQLEGKNMGVVLADADLDATVRELVAGALSYNGQRCTAIKLVVAHASIFDALVDKLAVAVERLPRGLPWDAVSITPLPEASKPAWLVELLEDALEKGATVRNPSGGARAGALFAPAVVAPVTPAMRLFHEEQFGPVVPVAAFDDLDEVVTAAKTSWSGQQVALFTRRDAAAAATLVDRLATIVGRANINTQCQRGPDVLPFSGRRSSAMGTMSVTDALRAFSVEVVVAGKPADAPLIDDLHTRATLLAPLDEPPGGCHKEEPPTS